LRQPASDVTAIRKQFIYLINWIKSLFLVTSNDEGECLFPYERDLFQMYFCEKIDPNLPSTCPILNGNGSTMNCTEGFLFKIKKKRFF
jgi:hypothetical protein